ncbi:hypothetical protein NKH71_31605 [Mesorhizobium sp. M0983]|uniref:hypothetical protein n=1 Tax=Mesorhizobium sp. M0983 TaxID=2957040 RepID=UPI00333BEC5C
MQLVRELITRLERDQPTRQAAPVVRAIAQNLQQRHSIAHRVSTEPKPAYSLDGGDGDA